MQFHRLQKVVKQSGNTILVGFIVGSYRCLDNKEHVVCQDYRSKLIWVAGSDEIMTADGFVDKHAPKEQAHEVA